jgi:hypothetical protein
MTATTLYSTPLGACTEKPDRWTTTPDDWAKAQRRACPGRWLGARRHGVAGRGGAVSRGRDPGIGQAPDVRIAPPALAGRAQRLSGARNGEIGLMCRLRAAE